MRRATVVAAAGCGLAMLAAVSCTPPPAPPLAPKALPSPASSPMLAPSPAPSSPGTPSPSSSPVTPSPAPSTPEAPSTSGPAAAVGEGKVIPADTPLLEAVRRHPEAGSQSDDSIIVIHREPAIGAGEFAWMPDDRTYCLAVVREGRADLTCKPLPTFWARLGIRLVTKGGPYPGGTGTRTVYFAVVDGGHGPYHYTGSATPVPDAGPVRDATAVFASGRTLSLLTYERPTADVPPRGGPDICSRDTAVCFPALDAYVG